MDTRVGCYAMVADDERRLLLAHWNEDARTGWTLPGGGLDRGEQPHECVAAHRWLRKARQRLSRNPVRRLRSGAGVS
jgi:ADP-ribose pyrophosphatase YjhB (NUDIX family)